MGCRCSANLACYAWFVPSWQVQHTGYVCCVCDECTVMLMVNVCSGHRQLDVNNLCFLSSSCLTYGGVSGVVAVCGLYATVLHLLGWLATPSASCSTRWSTGDILHLSVVAKIQLTRWIHYVISRRTTVHCSMHNWLTCLLVHNVRRFTFMLDRQHWECDVMWSVACR